jgi:hypothetical protein
MVLVLFKGFNGLFDTMLATLLHTAYIISPLPME